MGLRAHRKRAAAERDPITDRRIDFTTHRLTEVLNGDLAELLDHLSTHYQSEKLKDATAVS